MFIDSYLGFRIPPKTLIIMGHRIIAPEAHQGGQCECED